MATPHAPLNRTAEWLGALTGWRRALAAAAAGATAAFALSPGYAVPLWWLCLPVLIWMIRGSATARGAFWTGWWFGFGHFVFGLYWISFALWVDIARFWWAVPLAVAGLPMLLAIFTGFGAALFKSLAWRWRLQGAAEALLFAVIWTAMEWLRGHLFTGFPWNLVGYGWSAWLPVLQFASVAGIYGLSLLTVAAAAMPAAFAGPPERRRQAMAGTAAGLALFAAIAGWGAWRMAGTEGRAAEDVTIRIVQPNISQKMKSDRDARLANFQRLLQLSSSAGWDKVTAVVWPETAIPWLLVEGEPFTLSVTEALASVTPPGGYILAGTPRATLDGETGGTRYWNGMVAVDSAGHLAATYDKFHLVPFGEYMPFRSILPAGAVSAVAASAGDYAAGPGPRTLDLPGLPPVGPLICYEVIFPGNVAASVAPDGAEGPGRPAWLLNLTNDAWYGETSGPHQHFDIARVRAVEEGVPLVRAANTGISGIVDPYGRITASLGLGREGVVDAALPQAVPDATLYAQYGDWTLVTLLLFLSCLIVPLARRM
ncbi:apolipoprotein N-acyltransferase [Indioceanicola profundi]|uniref:apolipoprotein N-acyltransferase n=1 Tax=Indioceanicola profundi TaxID=2220096 RepID=UPI000E6AB5CE|nr:apolipoprotein N-acyltransferase [Indioceanicola profundi]